MMGWVVRCFFRELAKTKVMISCVVIAQLICAFNFAYAKGRFAHDKAHFYGNYSQTFVKRPYTTRHIFSFTDMWLLIAA